MLIIFFEDSFVNHLSVKLISSIKMMMMMMMMMMIIIILYILTSRAVLVKPKMVCQRSLP